MNEKQQLLIDRIDTVIGEMILVADQDGNLRAIDWADNETLMQRLLQRHYGENGFVLKPAKNPGWLSDTLRLYFAGDVTAIENVPVATAGTAFQREHTGWNNLVLCGTCPESRSPKGSPGRRLGQRLKSDWNCCPMPSRHRNQWLVDGLRRRNGTQALAP